MPAFAHTVAVVNRAAGGGAVRRIWSRMLAAIVEQTEGRLTIEWTPAAGAASALTRSALQSGADRILAVGGDGTVHEVVNGFFDDDGQPIAPEAVLAPLPCGTGGDFRRALGLPSSGVRAARNLSRAPTRRLDLVRVTCAGPEGRPCTTYVANASSCGLGGAVVQTVHRLPVHGGAYLGSAGGTLAYFGAILYSLATTTPDVLSIMADGQSLGQMEAWTVAVANGPSFGGGLRIAPHAELDDGWFDVVCLGGVSVGYLLRHALSFYRGRHLDLDPVRTFRAHQLRLAPTGDAPVWLEGDGELLGRLPATFEVVPRAIRVQG